MIFFSTATHGSFNFSSNFFRSSVISSFRRLSKGQTVAGKNVFFGADADNDNDVDDDDADADAGTHLKVFFSSAEIFCGRTRAREKEIGFGK